MSPELLDPDRFGREDGRATRESDCYALGMVILEVLSGKPPFSFYSGLIVMRKVIEGERPGRPQGKEEIWFTDDLWEMLGQCWLPRPERRPAIEAILQCLQRGSTTWQPLPPDLDAYIQSDSDDQSDFTSRDDPSIDSSMFLRLVLNLTRAQTAFVVTRIYPQDGRTPVPFQNQPRSVYTGQGSQQPAPGSQQRLAELPVSTMSDMADAFILYDNS